MSVRSIFSEAAAALKFNRQRSILTTISLAWGVACFVILYSYGDGFHFALRKAFMAVGQDLVLMFNGSTSTQAGGERAGRRIRMERTDVDAIRDTVPLAAAVSPEVMVHLPTSLRRCWTQPKRKTRLEEPGICTRWQFGMDGTQHRIARRS